MSPRCPYSLPIRTRRKSPRLLLALATHPRPDAILQSAEAALFGIGIRHNTLVQLALLLLAGCSRQEFEETLLRWMERRDRIESTPPPAQDAGVLDVRALRSPVLQIERGALTFGEKPLPYPGLASEWEKVLGVAKQPYRDKPAPGTQDERYHSCVLVWDSLGLTARGLWTTPEGQRLETCRVEQVDVHLDERPWAYLEGRPSADQPEKSFAGTLVVDGQRVERDVTWQVVYGALGQRGTKCPRGASTQRDMLCEHDGDCFYYVVQVAASPRRVSGFSVGWKTFTEPRCASAAADASLPPSAANHP